MASAPRRSLRLRTTNLPQDEKEESEIKVKVAPKRRPAIVAAAETKNTESPIKKKSKDVEEKIKHEEQEKEQPPTTINSLPSVKGNGRAVENSVIEEKKEDPVDENESEEPKKRSRRRCSIVAAEAVKKIAGSDGLSDIDDDTDFEKEMESTAKRTKTMKKEKDFSKKASSISAEKNDSKKKVAQTKNKKGVSMEDDTVTEDEDQKENTVKSKKNGIKSTTSKSSGTTKLQRPPSLDRPSEKVRLLRNRKYEVDRDEMIAWEKRAVHMTKELRKAESDRNNDTGRMKEVMDKVWDFVERCLKNRVCEMGEGEAVRLCRQLQGEFDEWERKKKMTITQRIKEKVENEKKEREAQVSDEDEEEEDEWEDMEIVDGEGEVKTVQVHIENQDKNPNWKTKYGINWLMWLKQEVNRTMRTRCENTHKVHLLSYLSHLRHLAAMGLSTNSKHGEIPLMGIALSMLPTLKKSKKKDRSDEWATLIEWWRTQFKYEDEEENGELSEEEKISERMMKRRFKNHKEAALMFFSLASCARFTIRIVCKCEVMTKKVPESPESKAKAEKKEQEVKKKISNSSEESRDDPIVDYWIEMWNEARNSWIPVSVFPIDSSPTVEDEENEVDGVNKLFTEPLNSFMEKGGKVLYMLAIDNKFGIRDVSARYVHSQNFVAKEFRKRRAGQEWLNELWDMEEWRADNARACKEDDEWLSSLKVELPKYVGQYKDHPLYVLDKDVLKMQRIFPYDVEPVGKIRTYNIYNRKYLRPTNTAKWYEKMGRQVRDDEPPVGEKKLTNPLTGESVMQGLFGYWQTDPWDAGEVVDGRIPRNEFDNIYMYQPKEMCPQGGIYIIPEGLQRVALELGKDFVQAVIGWIYKNGNIVPLIKGAVFAKEDIPELVGAWKECKRRWEEEERKIRSERALAGWKKLIKGMLRLAAMRKEFEPMENRKKKGTRLEDEAVRAEEAVAWPRQRYGGDMFEL